MVASQELFTTETQSHTENRTIKQLTAVEARLKINLNGGFSRTEPVYLFITGY
jgi:hypothetical protein